MIAATPHLVIIAAVGVWWALGLGVIGGLILGLGLGFHAGLWVADEDYRIERGYDGWEREDG